MTLKDESPIEASPFGPQRGRSAGLTRFLRRCIRRSIVLAVLLFVAAALFGALLYFQYRPDHQTSDAQARQAVSAASDGTVALLSYSSETLNRDFSNAKSRLTHGFLAYYQQFADQIVTPTAQRGVTTTAHVVRAAVSELHPNSAVVLVFVDQKAFSRGKPEPVLTPRTIRVVLTKIDGSWLIDQFDGM